MNKEENRNSAVVGSAYSSCFPHPRGSPVVVFLPIGLSSSQATYGCVFQADGATTRLAVAETEVVALRSKYTLAFSEASVGSVAKGVESTARL